MRIFNKRERLGMARKPVKLDEVGEVPICVARALALVNGNATVLLFEGSLDDLDQQIQEARARGDGACELIACDAQTSTVLAINTEGHDYARYAGRLSPDAEVAVIEAVFNGTPEPLACAYGCPGECER
jgi:hypothetical protein